MLLTLIRHAKSSWDNPMQDDHDRPLNERGLRAAPVMGAVLERDYFAAGKLPRPDAVVTSTARRARDTAAIIAGQIGFPAERIEEDRTLYLPSVSDIIRTARKLPAEVGHAIFFGHNPGFEDAALALAPGAEIPKFPTCAVCAIAFHAGSWAAVERGSGRCAAFLYPKMSPENCA